MQLTRLITDDDAVAPVIGVVLLVAITVILAAVAASFVLALGDQSQRETPAAAFTFEYEVVDEADATTSEPQGIVSVTHDGGDSVDYRELYIRGAGFNGTTDFEASGYGGDTFEDWVRSESGSQVHQTAAGRWNGTVSGDGSELVVAGDVANVYVASDYEVTVNFESRDGQASATLSSDEGPDA